MQMGCISTKLDPKYGDFITPEQHVPDTGIPGVSREVCMTMNTTWGYRDHDHQWKPSKKLVRTIIDIASKGGNYLLNVGPTADGAIPAESVERMQEVGRWMDCYGEAIYGSQPSPIAAPPWGRITRSNDGKTLYLHVFDWPDGGNLIVKGISVTPLEAEVLGTDSTISVLRNGNDFELSLPAGSPDAIAGVIGVKLKEPVPASSHPN